MQFELTPGGIRQMVVEGESPEGPTLFLNVSTNGEGGDPAGSAPPPEPQALPGVVPNERLLAYDMRAMPAPTMPAGPIEAINPRAIVKAAKQRRKELKAHLRQAVRWQKELSQLERLIAAADGKPIAPVRSIDSRRVG